MGVLRNSWISDRVEVRVSDRHGRGVFATKPITRGEKVAVFGGEILDMNDYMRLPPELRIYCMQIDDRLLIGTRSAEHLEPADYINHSCHPNCGFSGSIFLVAMRDIPAGEEIVFDYAMTSSRFPGEREAFGWACTCGAEGCRGRVTDDDWQHPGLQRRYAGYFSQYLETRIRGARATGT